MSEKDQDQGIISRKNISIHLARWVVPVTRPVIENAGVAISKGRIIAVESAKDLLRKFSEASEITYHEDALIMPCLVNVHCHLELSFASGRIPAGLGFSGWLKKLMSLRHEKMKSGDASIKMAASKALEELFSRGVCAIGDVGSSEVGIDAVSGMNKRHAMWSISFREIIHPFAHEVSLPDPADVSSARDRRRPAWCPHSVYTCSRQALKAIKKWCSRKDMPFSIHCSESPEEMEFVKTGRGPIAGILEERGRNIRAFFSAAPSPVRLLEEAGVLDPATVCVHCVHVDQKDINILSEKGCHICLCPGSNQYIGSGKAPVEQIFASASRRVCLGTDSLASNESLSIFGEMKKIMESARGISPELVLNAGTINGARALGLFSQIGSLEAGKRAQFLVMEGAPSLKQDIHEYICCRPEPFPLKVVGN